MIKFRTFQNPSYNIPSCDELPSETIPDQSLSIKEILERHIQGLPYPTSNPIWDDDDIDSDFDPSNTLDYDLTDYQNDMRKIESKYNSNNELSNDEINETTTNDE